MSDASLVGISKNFGQILAVNDVTLHVPDGTFMVLVGPSGCGKTTILRLIAGLEKPGLSGSYLSKRRLGEIRIANRLVNALSPAQRNVAMVFQNFALYPHMTAFQNIALPLEIRGFRRNEIDSRVQKLASLLEIKDLLDRFPRQVSGGQQQRIALGRAIIRQPSVLLMDEPLSNLDAQLRVQMRTELKQLQKSLHTTTVYVTHDQTEAMSMADLIVVMNQGLVQQVGTPNAIYSSPANTFVAKLVGSPSMNLFRCHLVAREGTYHLTGDGFALRLGIEHARALSGAVLSESGEIIAGIRPEHLRAKEDVKEPSSNSKFPTRVAVVEPLGSDTLLHLDWAAGRIVMRGNPNIHINEGDQLDLYCATEHIRLFDAESEAKIF